jgi:hypothetical protein
LGFFSNVSRAACPLKAVFTFRLLFAKRLVMVSKKGASSSTNITKGVIIVFLLWHSIGWGILPPVSAAPQVIGGCGIFFTNARVMPTAKELMNYGTH